jgi:alpha-kinase family protein
VFQVSDGFLIKTYDVPNANASVDLSFGEEGSDTEAQTRDLTSVYLVEPRRASSAVLKFSGTLGAQNRQDKRSATVMAFSHFVVEDTACQYMFADIQGSHSLLIVPIYESFLLSNNTTHTQDQWIVAQLCTMSRC